MPNVLQEGEPLVLQKQALISSATTKKGQSISATETGFRRGRDA